MESPRALIFALAVLAVLSLVGLRFAALISERHASTPAAVASAEPECAAR